MTFEEQFPSLIWKYHNIEFPTPEGIEIRMAIKEKDIQENCLDKKKVKNVIDKFKNNEFNSFLLLNTISENHLKDMIRKCNKIFEELKKELGL